MKKEKEFFIVSKYNNGNGSILPLTICDSLSAVCESTNADSKEVAKGYDTALEEKKKGFLVQVGGHRQHYLISRCYMNRMFRKAL